MRASSLTSHLPVCYFLYIASPLTLSEVRSMLPQGATADLVSFAEQQRLKAIYPETQTVARILVGRCSCNLVRPRQEDQREDERHLRERYRRLAVGRDIIIKALERHRRGAVVRSPGEGWPQALASFVAEHARNAGPTLYLLEFSPEPALAQPEEIRSRSVADVRGKPEGWLEESRPTIVAR